MDFEHSPALLEKGPCSDFTSWKAVLHTAIENTLCSGSAAVLNREMGAQGTDCDIPKVTSHIFILLHDEQILLLVVGPKELSDNTEHI